MVSAASSGVMSRRSVNVEHDHDAHVTVRIESTFAPWVFIDPQEFDIKGQETKEVSFETNVPLFTPNGNYSGKVIFCFKDKK